MLREKEIKALSGWTMIVVLLGLIVLSSVMMVSTIRKEDAVWVMAWVTVLVVSIVGLFGLTVVNPNEAKVVQLFGKYQGTLKSQGFQWINPLTSRRSVSLRVRNFESNNLKVNDHDGNPIEIAAVVV